MALVGPLSCEQNVCRFGRAIVTPAVSCCTSRPIRWSCTTNRSTGNGVEHYADQSNSSMHQLRVRSTVQRHQSQERPILPHTASSIPRSSEDVIMNVFHPSCAWPPRWSPPVLWRKFEGGLASICIPVNWYKMPKGSETTGLAIECPGFFLGTIDPLHQSAVYSPC